MIQVKGKHYLLCYNLRSICQILSIACSELHNQWSISCTFTSLTWAQQGHSFQDLASSTNSSISALKISLQCNGTSNVLRHHVMLLSLFVLCDFLSVCQSVCYSFIFMLYPVSQKNCKFLFCQITTKFDFSAERWQRDFNYASCIHFPPQLICVTTLLC